MITTRYFHRASKNVFSVQLQSFSSVPMIKHKLNIIQCPSSSTHCSLFSRGHPCAQPSATVAVYPSVHFVLISFLTWTCVSAFPSAHVGVLATRQVFGFCWFVWSSAKLSCLWRNFPDRHTVASPLCLPRLPVVCPIAFMVLRLCCVSHWVYGPHLSVVCPIALWSSESFQCTHILF